MTPAVVLGIGANLGDRLGALRGAVAGLGAAAGRVTAVSPVYETDPVGGPVQPSFLNAVVLLATALSPDAVLAVAQSLESAAGRVRHERWGPRPLDVDLVDYAGVSSENPRLTLPHPRAATRAFVLVPWLDVDPHATLGGRSVTSLVNALDVTGVRRRDDLALVAPVDPAQVP